MTSVLYNFRIKASSNRPAVSVQALSTMRTLIVFSSLLVATLAFDPLSQENYDALVAELETLFRGNTNMPTALRLGKETFF